MAIHTLNWLSSCAENIRAHAAVCEAVVTQPVSHQAAVKRVERSTASQARKARTVLVLLLDAQGEWLLRRRTARQGSVEWDLFGAAVREGQTLSEAAFCELCAALPQLAQVPGRQGVPTLQNNNLPFRRFQITNSESPTESAFSNDNNVFWSRRRSLARFAFQIARRRLLCSNYRLPGCFQSLKCHS